MLIAIEGVDGAGKRTLAEGLRKAFEQAGKSVATLAFPRYGQSLTADIAAEALHGGHGDLASSVYAMALLFALDRASAIDDIQGLCREHDVVILDRYVASNAAYSAARLHETAAGEAVAWVQRIEYQRLGLPSPDWQVLLAVSPEVAGERARSRAVTDPDRARDSYERDHALQQRTGAAYADLAASGWGGRWLVVDSHVDPGRLAASLTGSQPPAEAIT
ncbi:dTMP kinase [Mycobacterium spongiae]|uniref:Thymidylate kinase n=1 Tax=Mycobacterium spongiae TaxID=886343 RepID=A0A975PWC2_9MYCO|nr:dTMP kinase [Mycobacterium spongiae]QUR66629.1 dTMP kinase [Mycobacterium spongiae]